MRPDDRSLCNSPFAPGVIPFGKVFWLVWSPGGKTPPSVIYVCYEAALEAAEHMARTCRGQDFYVLQAQSKSSVDGVKTTTLE